MTDQAVGRSSGLNLKQRRQRAAFWFLAPMLIALFVVAAWPLLRTIWFSLTDATLSNLYDAEWIGFKNYLQVRELSSGKMVYRGTLVDPAWWNAVWNTVRFSIVSVVFETIFGLIVALVLNAEFRGRALVRAAILIPWAIPTIVSAKMWAWMLNDQFGIINDILLNMGLISERIAWTANVDTAMTAVLIVDIWKTTPFMALLILAGLQMVPRDIYEAAAIDGVHPIKTFWKVTLPLVRPSLTVATVLNIIYVFNSFPIIWTISKGAPADKTHTLVTYLYQLAFFNGKSGEAAAVSVIGFLILCVFAGIYMVMTLRAEGNQA